MSEEQPQEPEYVDDGSMTEADAADWQQISKSRPRARSARIGTIGRQILTWCAQLNWTQKRAADEIGMDESQFGKIVSGRYLNVQLATLARIAETFRVNGLSDIDVQMLIDARDEQLAEASGKRNPLEIPDHWKRLIIEIRMRGEDYATSMFLQLSLTHRETSHLIDKNPLVRPRPEDQE